MKWRWAAVVCLATGLSAWSQDSIADAPVPVDPKTMHPPTVLNSPIAEFPHTRHPANGSCGFTLIVDANGDPQNLKLVRCTDAVFSKNAEDAVRKYRFRPATMLDGKPVTVIIHINVDFRSDDGEPPVRARVGWGFGSPPGMTDTGPDPNGVYPLMKSMQAPKPTGLRVKGFEAVAMWLPENSRCDTVLTLDAKGKVTDVQIISCDDKAMEKPTLETLHGAKFSPGALNNNSVPVRMLFRLIFQGIEPDPIR